MLDGRISDDFADALHSHDFADINGTVLDGQVPDDITVNHAIHATDADFAGDADNLDGLDSSGFAVAGHGHDFADITGQITDDNVPMISQLIMRPRLAAPPRRPMPTPSTGSMPAISWPLARTIGLTRRATR